MDFLRFSTGALLFEIRFYTEAPGSFQSITSMPLVHRKVPGKKETRACNWVPETMEAAGSPESGGSGEVLGRGRCGEGIGVHLISVCDRSWGGTPTSERRRRRRYDASAAA
jgi:hypothetical protein